MTAGGARRRHWCLRFQLVQPRARYQPRTETSFRPDRKSVGKIIVTVSSPQSAVLQLPSSRRFDGGLRTVDYGLRAMLIFDELKRNDRSSASWPVTLAGGLLVLLPPVVGAGRFGAQI